MKKILSLGMFIIFAFLPVFAQAAQIRTGADNIRIASNETIEDDLYIASGAVNVGGKVIGDLVAAGGQIDITGEVTGDILVAGGNISISGKVGDDIRVAGGNVTILGEVNDDVITFGGNVDIASGAKVSGDVKAGAGTMIISGGTGSVEAGTGTLLVKSTAKIEGSLIYASEREAVIEAGSFIKDGITFNKTNWSDGKDMVGWFVFPKIYSVLTTILVALLFVWFMPNKTEKLAVSFRNKMGSSLLRGFLFVIAVPVLAILSFVTVLGAPLGLMGLVLYGIVLYLAKIVAVISLGAWVQSLISKKKELDKIWIGIIIGTLFYSLLKMIPVIGWLAIMVVYLASLGNLIKFDWLLIKDLKDKKIL